VPLFDVASHRASHQFGAGAAGLQATGSTLGSKEPNILANYSRALPGFDVSRPFLSVLGPFGGSAAVFGRVSRFDAGYAVRHILSARPC
jgi:hypothetical protein